MSNGNLYDSPVCRVGTESTASPQQFTASAGAPVGGDPVDGGLDELAVAGGQHHRDVPDRGVLVAGRDVALERADRDQVGGAHLQRGRVEVGAGPGEVVCAYWSIGVTITRSATKNFSSPARTTRKTPTPSSTGPTNRRMDFPSSPQPR